MRDFFGYNEYFQYSYPPDQDGVLFQWKVLLGGELYVASKIYNYRTVNRLNANEVRMIMILLQDKMIESWYDHGQGD